MRANRLLILTITATLVGLTLTACGSSSAGADDGITVVYSNSLSRVPSGGFYLLGYDKGFFKDHGIDDITFQVAADSSTATQTVANNRAQFAVLTTVPSFLSIATQGAKVTMVGQDSAATEIGVFSDPSSNITKPSDLAGKTVAVPPGTPQSVLWDSYLQAAGVDPGSVHTVNVASNALVQALTSHRVDAIVQSKLSAVPLLAAAGLSDPAELPFSAVGLDVKPGSGVVTSQQEISQDPDQVRDFLAAAKESLAYALKHPDELADSINKHYPGSTTAQAAAEQLKSVSAGFDQELPVSQWMQMDPSAWASTVEQLTKAGAIKTATDASSLYTNEYLETSK